MFKSSVCSSYIIKYFDKQGYLCKAQTIRASCSKTALVLGRTIVDSTPEYHSCIVFVGNLQAGSPYFKTA
ncbi:MAG: hypothetical protein IKV41_03220 [Oscillospiraceae bacterium]|nr:hypothetical protein [Oscillospiraceae bacterium]